jgi:hypothetical protein
MSSTLKRVLAGTAIALGLLGAAGGTAAVSAASASGAAHPYVYMHA